MESDVEKLQSLKGDVERLQKQVESFEDFQGLVAARGMLEKVEQYLFEKGEGGTRYQRWAAIEKGSVSLELNKLLEPCKIRDLPGSSLKLMKNLSGFIHNLNLVQKIKPPSYFGEQQKCFFEALKEYCSMKSIPLNDENFVIDTFKVVMQDMDKYYEEKGREQTCSFTHLMRVCRANGTGRRSPDIGAKDAAQERGGRARKRRDLMDSWMSMIKTSELQGVDY